MAKKAAYPRSRRPANPTTMLSPRASSTYTSASVAAFTWPALRSTRGERRKSPRMPRGTRYAHTLRTAPMLGTLRELLAQEARGPEDQHEDEHREHGDLGPLEPHVLGGHDLDEADDESPEGRPRRVPDPAQHRRGEGDEPRPEAVDEPDVPVVEARDHPGGARQDRPHEEGQGDGLVDVDAHDLGRHPVLGGGPHRLAELGPLHEQVQGHHHDHR